MPARIELTPQQIREALVATGGAVAAAARRLGISTRTLQRRLAQSPHLSLPPARDAIWALAQERTEKHWELASFDASTGDFRPLRWFAAEVEWSDADVELEPRELWADEVAAFFSSFSPQDLQVIDVERHAEQVRRRRRER